MFNTPTQTVPPSCHTALSRAGPSFSSTRGDSFQSRHGNLFCLSTAASASSLPPYSECDSYYLAPLALDGLSLVSPPASPSPSPVLPSAPLLPSAPIFATTSRTQRESSLRSLPMKRSPGMMNMAMFTREALDEDELKVEAIRRQEAADALDGSWKRSVTPLQFVHPEPILAGGFSDGGRWSPAELPDSPLSYDDESDEEGPFAMDDSSDEEQDGPRPNAWTSSPFSSPASMAASCSSWGAGHSANTSVSSWASFNSPKSRSRSTLSGLSKIVERGQNEYHSATDERFEDADAVARATGWQKAEVEEGLGLGFGFAL